MKLTDHAISRFHERVRPNLLRDAAKADLERLVTTAGPIFRGHPKGDIGFADDAFSEIAPGVWLGLREGADGWIVTTCLTNSGFSEERRAKRNAAKAKRRAERRRKVWRNGERANKGSW